jgi:hypothetical protein
MGESKVIGVRMGDSLIARIKDYQDSQGLSSQSAAILDLIELGLNKNVKHRKGDVKQIESLRSELSQAIADLRSELLGKIQETSQEKQSPAIAIPPGGLTNAQLSEQTGIPKTTIERWKATLKRGGTLPSKNPLTQKLSLTDDGLWILNG